MRILLRLKEGKACSIFTEGLFCFDVPFAALLGRKLLKDGLCMANGNS